MLDEFDSLLSQGQRIYETAVSHANPYWLSHASDLMSSPDELPEDAVHATNSLGVSLTAVPP